MRAVNVIQVVRELWDEHGRFPTVEEFAERVGVEPTVQLEVHLLQVQRTLDILARRVQRGAAD